MKKQMIKKAIVVDQDNDWYRDSEVGGATVSQGNIERYQGLHEEEPLRKMY